MFKIRLSPKAKKQLKRISRRHQFALGQIFEDLKDEPFLGKPLTRDLTGKFSYRVSVFRIVYKISEQDRIVNILSAGLRGTVYKRIRR